MNAIYHNQSVRIIGTPHVGIAWGILRQADQPDRVLVAFGKPISDFEGNVIQNCQTLLALMPDELEAA